jgi:hypothetical protein
MKTLAINPTLYGADKLECDMSELGYVRSPNNIYGLPSVHWQSDDPPKGLSPEWYAGCGGLPAPKMGVTVQVCNDRIRLFTAHWFGEHGSKRCFWDLRTVAVFETVAEFVEWCAMNGEPSLPGINYGYND